MAPGHPRRPPAPTSEFKKTQYRPDVIDGCFRGTGLARDQPGDDDAERDTAPDYAAGHDKTRVAPADHQLLAVLAGSSHSGPGGAG
ncbi:hypothetical protein GCM10010195_63200 [Kitasatospora griseola]|nr:hypothetical protein GCM10010195_63200 [Kitasatospora griseola]